MKGYIVLVGLLVATVVTEQVVAQPIGDCEIVQPQQPNSENTLDQCLAFIQVLETKNDTQKLRETYRNVGTIYQNIKSLQKALEYYNKALILDLKNKLYQQQGEDYRNLGDLYYTLENYEQAIGQYQGLLAIARWLKNPFIAAEADYKMGLSYEASSKPEKVIELQKKAIRLALRTGDNQLLARSYLSLGSAHITLKQYTKALQDLNEALNYDTLAKDKTVELKIYSSFGIASYSLNNYPKSIEYQNKALEIALETQDLPGQSDAYSNLGLAYYSRNEYDQALTFQNKALETALKTKDEKKTSDAHGNLGLIYFALGEYTKAAEYQQISLKIAQGIDYSQGEVASLSNLGIIQDALEDYRQAIVYYEQALSKLQALQNKQGLGILYSNLAIAYKSLKSFAKAEEFYNKALSIFEEAGDKMSLAQVYGNLGNVYEQQQQFDRALTFQQRALALYSDIGTVEDIYYPQWGIARVLLAQNQQDAAILFYKRAVNTIQASRDKIKLLDPKLRKSFAESKAVLYRQLADLLLKQGRVGEAQRVLEVLKEQELIEYLRSTIPNSGNLSLTAEEQKNWENYQKNILGKEVALYRQRSAVSTQIQTIALAERNENNVTYKKLAEQFDQIDAQISAQTRVFKEIFLPQLTASLTKKAKQDALTSDDLINFSKKFSGRRAAVISPLILPDRIEIILLLPGVSPIQRTVKNVKGAEVEKLVLYLHDKMASSGSGVQQDLQTLYQYLFAPVQPEIDQFFSEKLIDTVVFNPDVVLRLIPMSALYDGKQYLIERYAIATISRYSVPGLPSASNPTLLAMGISKAHENFQALPGVVAELATLSTLFQTSSVLDENFTERNFKASLQAQPPTYIHLATHANFGNTAKDSYVLLWDKHLTLDALATLDLPQVDLLTLSACKTATGDEKAGLGLSGVAEKSGAFSVLGTLWSVADVSTSKLMQLFYSNLKAGLPKAEALRQAQIVLIRGTAGEGESDQRRGGVGVVSSRSNQEIPNQTYGFSDPFYWAPFVLLGNWK